VPRGMSRGAHLRRCVWALTGTASDLSAHSDRRKAFGVNLVRGLNEFILPRVKSEYAIRE